MIGAPVTNVRTPALLEKRFVRVGIKARVEAQHVEPSDFDGFIRDSKADDSVDGLLVTMPYKKAIIPHLETVSAVAQLVGSVNTVKRMKSRGFVGAQFDGPALVRALLAKHVPLGTARVFLLGVGGAGLAIAHAIAAHGCGCLAIADRDAGVVDGAMKILRGDIVCRAAPMRHPGGGAYDLLINATPLGMKDGDPSPFDAELVARASSVADIVADPAQTALEGLAKETSATFVSGRDMVKGQIKPICDWLLVPNVEQEARSAAMGRDR